METGTVLVAGASGVVGRAALEHFAARPGWRAIAVSRTPPDSDAPHRHVPLDLRDAASCLRAAPAFADVTHVVYAALQEKPGLVRGWRERDQMETNLAMLRNLGAALERGAPGLRHVSLLQGTKAYGVHLRPMKVPGRERDPRDGHDNFYWLQEDWLREAASRAGWGWTILRPQIVFGHALGAPMNLLPAIGAYAATQKARGEPLHWPGGASYVAEATCARLLARALAWAATTPRCAGEIFNIANGDVFTWPNVWPAVARALGMAPGEARPLRLAEEMPRREDEWAAIVARHRLRPLSLRALAGDSFVYADFNFAPGKDGPLPPAIVSTVKARQFGFADCVDTEDMFADWFAELGRLRILPPP